MQLTYRNQRAKKQNLIINLIIFALAVVVVDGLLIFVGVLYPGFLDLIVCGLAIYTAILTYFTVVRAIILNKQACYGFDERKLTFVCGFPLVKEFTVLISDVEKVIVKNSGWFYGKDYKNVTVVTSSTEKTFRYMDKNDAEKFAKLKDGQHEEI